MVTDRPETIAVVVVTYNSEHLLADLVASFGPGMAGLAWHLTVADNASADHSVKMVQELVPAARVVEMGRNAGYAAGINAAVAALEPHTAILVLNPDIRLAPNCVAELLQVMRRRGAAVTVPRISQRDGQFSPSLRREPTTVRALADAIFGAHRVGRFPALGEVVTVERQYEVETRTDWAEGSISMIDAGCARECGPWDESFFLYSEETEYMLRIRDRGMETVLAPRANATHLGGSSTTSPPLWALLMVNRARLYRRRHSLLNYTGYWAALLLRESIRAALGNPCSRLAARWLLRPSLQRKAFGPIAD